MNVERKSFIEELRSLSGPVKRKVALGATVVSMVVVVYFWLAYFNTIMQNTANATAAQPSITMNAPAVNIGLVGLFTNAASSLWETTLSGAKNIVGAVENSRQYNINPKR